MKTLVAENIQTLNPSQKAAYGKFYSGLSHMAWDEVAFERIGSRVAFRFTAYDTEGARGRTVHFSMGVCGGDLEISDTWGVLDNENN